MLNSSPISLAVAVALLLGLGGPIGSNFSTSKLITFTTNSLLAFTDDFMDFQSKFKLENKEKTE